MRTFRAWLTRLRQALLPSDRDEITDEIESHLQLHIDDNIRAGMTPADARRAALLQLGPAEALKDDYRARQSIRLLDSIKQDVASGSRVLTRSPYYATVAILSLALGIGANTALFSILDSLLFKPLPVRDPQQLVAVASDQAGQDASLTYPIWRQIRDRGLFATPFVWAPDLLTASEGNQTSSLEVIWADGAFFDVLGTSAFAGRILTAADDQRGGGPDGPVAVISDAFWSGHFGRDRGAVGRTLMIESVAYRIVGITQPEFFGLEVGRSFDVILPLETEPLLQRIPSRLDSPFWPWLHVTGRLNAGDRIDALTARLRAAQPQIRTATMPPYSKAELRDAYLRAPWSVRSAATGSSPLRERYSTALFVLLAIVALVLLIACANIANLQLARTSARTYEFGLRRALGASRGRIVQQQLVESLLLSIAGALIGYLFAQWGCRLMVAQLSTWASAAFLDFSPDLRVLGATAFVTASTTLLYGVAPAIRAARTEPLAALKRSAVAPANRTLATSAVVLQIALSCALVISAMAFVRSFAALAYRDLGFDRDRVLVGVLDTRRVAGPATGRTALYERVREAVGSVPGVEAAGISTATPLGNAGVRFTTDASVPGMTTAARNTLMNPVSTDWFRTYGTRLIGGRDFTRADRAAAIVNAAFVRRLFANADALGRELILMDGASHAERVEVIGIVEDAAFVSVRDAIPPTVYRPFDQVIDETERALPSVSISVRAAPGIPPLRLAAGVAAAIAAVNPDLKVSFRSLSIYLHAYYIRERLLALMCGFFGALALLLAAVGVFGVTAYSVNERRSELALRLALGATRWTIGALVGRRVCIASAAGLLAGSAAAWWGMRFVGSLLFGIDAHDPLTFAAAASSIALVMAVATWLPARRAGRANLARVLREV